MVEALSAAWVIAALRQWQKKGWEISRFLTVPVNCYGGNRGYRAEQIRRKLPPPAPPGHPEKLEGN